MMLRTGRTFFYGACISAAAAFTLTPPVGAAPTGGVMRGPAMAFPNVFNREIRDERVTRDEPQVVDARRPSVAAFPTLSGSAPGFLRFSGFGHSLFGEPPGAPGCPNAAYGPILFAVAPEWLAPGDCFGTFYSTGDSLMNPLLAPGGNKNALYGRAYHPDSNVLQ